MIIICPAISIIVPVYKVEPYLSRCIDSILAQSFTDFELILVDDGSPDNCGAICDEYAKKDSRITVIHRTNGGLSVARNTGIDRARGEYLCFIDSDDLVSPDYCRLLYQTACSKHCKITACKIERFASDNFAIEKKTDIPGKTSSMPYSVLLKKQMGQEIEMGVWCKLFHCSVFEKIRFQPGKLHEDIIFAGDLLAEDALDVSCVDIPLYFYRQRPESIVNQQVNTARCSPDRIFAGNYLLECAKKAEFEYMEDCLAYAVQYPWSFVDSIYVHHRFRENRSFLDVLQKTIRSNYREYRNLEIFSRIQRHRMLLFARSKILYGLNAYARLFRVYLYHVLKLDAYSDGHGI